MRLLYLDFDGVLHPAEVFHKPGVGPTLSMVGNVHALFENIDLLAVMLMPFADVRIVVSSSWVVEYGLDFALSRLPVALRNRTAGATFDPNRHGAGFRSIARGYQIAEDAARRGVTEWAALDDDFNDWPAEHQSRLIRTDPILGLRAPEARKRLQAWLAGPAALASSERGIR